MEKKQNQTLFRGTCLNLTSSFIGRKILKYFNNFYNWHFPISFQKSAQTSKVNANLISKIVHYLNDFEIYFLIRFIRKMSDSSTWGKICLIWFHFVNVKGYWIHLTEKHLQPGAWINTIFMLSWKCLYRIILKTF